MRIFIMLAIMCTLGVGYVQASTIVLKDGRAITGDIVQQDKSKVIVNVAGNSLTYYRDEIVSIKEEPAAVQDNPIGGDEVKEKLVEQYIKLFPADARASTWAKYYALKHPGFREATEAYLKDDQNIAALTVMLKQGAMKYFTADDLKAVINFYTSPDGAHYLKDYEEFRDDTLRIFISKLRDDVDTSMGGK